MNSVNISQTLIRYAESIDAQILGKIHSESWKVAYKNTIPSEVLDKITADKRAIYFKKALSEGLEEDAIIYRNDNDLGFICFGKCRDNDLDSTFGEIWGIYLLPEFWRQGVGSKLINFAVNELKNKGYRKISLWVLENNKNAIKFYEKQGFKYAGTKKEIVIGIPLNECRYVKVIE